MAVDDKDEAGLFARRVGDELAAARNAQKIEIEDIASRTRIPARHLDAIERSDFAALPALPYAAGFVKTYANTLGLDGNAMSRAFRDEVGDVDRAAFQPQAYEPADPSRVPSKLLAMIALGVAVLLGMGYLLLRFEGDSSDLAQLAADTPENSRPAGPAPAAPVTRTVVAPVAQPAEPAVPTGPIGVTATEDVWLKISERTGGPTYYMDVMKAGERFDLPETATDPILRTGRPQSIKVMIGTAELPAIGEPDRLVRAYSLKRDAVTAIATGKPLPEASPVAPVVDQPRSLRRFSRPRADDSTPSDAAAAPEAPLQP
ncbi:helix-turn-helix domain-containing protein [Sphingomonas montanisoli]|uniref:Helix-turn-helix domain-containing protein n=1 Tax=Sphingomonas montanisoli TaxID=2606412 RepID=A0A5D9BZ09_9SPHN|nr:helix-turn-helix domain-containing protein [Sphingomonas montanisoli]TZG24669.1 helix-turn-helix domain-containing protein [Sphingomonas montanisoli]